MSQQVISRDAKLVLLAIMELRSQKRSRARAFLQRLATDGETFLLSQKEELGSELLSRAAELSDLAARHEISVVAMGEAAYPERLANIPDAPPLLFVKGDINSLVNELQRSFSVAVVGARRATPYGERAATRIAEEVALAGGVVVSGLARGIDSAAHRGALTAHDYYNVCPGVAVLGSGLLRVYPAQNLDLAAELCDKGGCVISEYPPFDPPSQWSFPERNRIVSGLADAVVVIEAGERSGALITARLASEQGRDVLVVPGAIDSAASVGSNNLIAQGAPICRGVADILDGNPRLKSLASFPALELPADSRVAVDETQRRKQRLAGLNEEDRQFATGILGAIDREGIVEFDRLLQAAVTEAPRLRATLIELELAGLVYSRPGNCYSTAESIDR